MRPESPKLDEPSRMRPGVEISDCEPIVLADGQAWLFPRPRVDYVPKFGPQGTEVVVEVEWAEYFDRFAAAVTPHDHFVVQFELGRAMLLKVYVLTDEQIAGLLRSRLGSKADEDRWFGIVRLASGLGTGSLSASADVS
jgi:hypothetical protein